MKSFWEERYKTFESIYGDKPNYFFKEFIDKQEPGSVLLPAEGEGRNAVYAAKNGWVVEAFDFSETARDKASQKAAEAGLMIHYEQKDITEYKARRQYDIVALIYVHQPAEERMAFHSELVKSLAPRGYLIIEAFTKEQVHYTSGGPKDPELLYTPEMIVQDFAELDIVLSEQLITDLDEGTFHQGTASIFRFIGRKV